MTSDDVELDEQEGKVMFFSSVFLLASFVSASFINVLDFGAKVFLPIENAREMATQMIHLPFAVL